MTTAVAKLYYYKATGRAHQLRLALAAANILFEDVCGVYPPTDEQKIEWSVIGGNSTTNVPMLVLADGSVYTQSSAILRAVARMGELMPTDDKELYLVDKILADCEDLRTLAYSSFSGFGAPQSKADAYIESGFAKHAGNLERQIVEIGDNNDCEYFLGKTFSIVDISVYDAITNYGTSCIPGDALKEFPKLKTLMKRVTEQPRIAVYLASEQYAEIQKFSPALLGKQDESSISAERLSEISDYHDSRRS